MLALKRRTPRCANQNNGRWMVIRICVKLDDFYYVDLLKLLGENYY